MVIMPQIACVLAVVLCCIAHSQSCCYPARMEATLDLTIGMVNDEGKTLMTKGYYLISLDIPGKNIYIDEHVSVGNTPVRTSILQLFNEREQYIIINSSTCLRTKLPEWQKNGCIPGNATWTQEFRISVTDVKAMDYGWSIGDLSYIMTITSYTCIPVFEEVIGNVGHEKMQATIKYKDVTQGIKDLSVFEVPEICQGVPMENEDLCDTPIFSLLLSPFKLKWKLKHAILRKIETNEFNRRI